MYRIFFVPDRVTFDKLSALLLFLSRSSVVAEISHRLKSSTRHLPRHGSCLIAGTGIFVKTQEILLRETHKILLVCTGLSMGCKFDDLYTR